MQKIITCAGYHGSGSSAITDLLKEFNNCESMGSYEFRFIQDPFGISDLEYQIVENFHRLNSGYYLKKFKKKVDNLSGKFMIKRYEKFFNDNFKKYSYEYINNLTKVTWNGQWSQEIEENQLYFYLHRLLVKILRVFTNNKEREINLRSFNKNKMLLPKVTKEEFYCYTKLYLDKLFREANLNNKEFIVLDQLVPSTNIERYQNYFYNLKTIIVDRDPRDIYILEKEKWKDNVIPAENIFDYVKWFKLTRENTDYKNENILKVKFEDLIYNYENTVNDILKFLNINEKEHKLKKKYFNPEVSKHNTQLWKKFSKYEKEIEIIEKELKTFCVDYEESKNV